MKIRASVLLRGCTLLVLSGATVQLLSLHHHTSSLREQEAVATAVPHPSKSNGETDGRRKSALDGSSWNRQHQRQEGRRRLRSDGVGNDGAVSPNSVAVSASSSRAVSSSSPRPSLTDAMSEESDTDPRMQPSRHAQHRQSLARAAQQASVTYRPWNPSKPYSWCDDGFYFAKTHKTGSSSAAAVHLRISDTAVRKRRTADKHHRRTTSADACKQDFRHQFLLRRKHVLRDTDVTFLWTIVRHPTSRALSSYYFYEVGHSRETDTSDALFRHLEQSKNQQVYELRHDPSRIHMLNGVIQNRSQLPSIDVSSTTSFDAADFIRRDILSRYNFVAVQERWEESLVVLQLLLGIDDEDIVTLSSTKSSGSWSWDWLSPSPACFAIPEWPTWDNNTKVQDYLQQQLNKDDNLDVLLHAAAIRSLERTITQLGRDAVYAALERHRTLKAYAEQQCMSQVSFPCSATGEWQPKSLTDCQWRDIGCGHRCIERAMRRYRSSVISSSVAQ